MRVGPRVTCQFHFRDVPINNLGLQGRGLHVVTSMIPKIEKRKPSWQNPQNSEGPGNYDQRRRDRGGSRHIERQAKDNH